MFAKKDYYYHLPDDRIAKYPIYPHANRSDSKLLVVGDGKKPVDTQFKNLADYLDQGDLIVMNNTKVIPARINGKKSSGASAEIFIEKIISKNKAFALVKTKRAKVGNIINVSNVKIELIESKDSGWIIKSNISISELIKKYGKTPIPPYLEREVENSDINNYQTIYAKNPGAVAAPTAGLHFDTKLINRLKKKNIQIAEIILHIGAGTFLPLRNDDIRIHQMHSEYYEINNITINKIKKTKKLGKKIIAIGTSTLRTLETIAVELTDKIRSQKGYTDIYITPEYQFKLVDRLITNFHQPYSTLLILVSAFTGRKVINRAYKYALANSYRFLSYGDGMLIDYHKN